MVRDRFCESNRVPIKLKLIGTHSKDRRQYNFPTATEVAALVVAGDEDNPSNKDIVLEEHGGRLKRITEFHPSYMVLQYPLLFPYGVDGYRTDISHRDAESNSYVRSKLSQREWCAYRIQFRFGEGHTLLMCARLTQQFFCDAYTSVLAERTTYVYKHQARFRSDIVQGLEDAVVRGDTTPSSIGKRIILPSSVTGSPRYMVQAYQDSMAIVRWAGPPDFFLTFTTNPKWPEISEALKLIPGQKPEDRPDLVSRVFKIKLDQLIHDITKGEHFGKAKAVVYTVEFQKRGLPHAHIALFLNSIDKPNDVKSVDRIISAELPDQNTDPVAFKAVTQFMLHGPCGSAYPSSPCMVDRKCEKHFPKQFHQETTLSTDGFPVYMRRENGRTAKVKGVELDNSWVVPHNVDLIVKYNAHINVELCNQSRCIKYLFKYMCKGEDRATLMIQENVSVNNQTGEITVVPVNELQRYLSCTYVSGSEST